MFAGCAGGNDKVDPCEANPQPGCPNYVDPCETNPQPGCPNYVEPDTCVENPQPGCPNYDVDPVLANAITLGTTSYAVTTTKDEFEDGFWYIKAHLPDKPLVIHAVRYNTHKTGYSIEAWSGKDSVSGKETPAAMVSRYATAGRQVKAAINGGFYGMATGGVPTGAEIVRGMMTNLGDVATQPVVGFDADNHAYIDFLRFNAKVKKSNGAEAAITSVNDTRWADYLVLYNSAKGKRTGTNEWGTEVLCAPKAGQWEALASHLNVRCGIELVEPQSGKGNMAIPKGKIVLSGNGTGNAFLSGLQTGGEVEVTVDYTLQRYPEVNANTLRNAVAGYNIVLRNSVVVNPDPTAYDDPTLLTASHPRTAVGYSAQKDFVWFVVVDGRSTASTGVSTRELGQVMLFLGASDAINLDGGGSSCLMVGASTKNTPSDGSQRAVCNGLAIVKQ
jgi:exopolysaccharide biosynthesis protein